MATNLKLIREVEITNGSELRTAQIWQAAEGVFFGEKDSACDLVQLSDDSDSSLADAIRDNGFSIAE